MKSSKKKVANTYNAKRKFKVEIDVWGIEVEETSPQRGWYKLDYQVKLNGKKQSPNALDGSWSNQTKQHFQRILKSDWAFHLVIRHLFG